MKQAIQEGFILDVLGHYTSIQSYFNLVKQVEEDPELTPNAPSAPRPGNGGDRWVQRTIAFYHDVQACIA